MDVRLLSELDDLRAVTALFDEIWHGGPVLITDHVKALAHAGNYVAGAWSGDELVGASVGFFATPLGSALHSDVTGVRRRAANQGVGLALKLHQRAWALGLGLTEIRWTFDPLVARNAYFNVERLRADAAGYHIDFYGEMRDGVNAGQGSDRVVMSWPLTAPRVVAVSGGSALPRVAPAAAPALLREESGSPSLADVPGEEPRVTIAIPPDIEALRRADPDRARSWREALRATLGVELDAGSRVTHFRPDVGYVVERPRP